MNSIESAFFILKSIIVINGLSSSNQATNASLEKFPISIYWYPTLPPTPLTDTNPCKALHTGSQPVCIPVDRLSRAWLRFYDHDSGLFLNCNGHNWLSSKKGGEKRIWPGKAFNLFELLLSVLKKAGVVSSGLWCLRASVSGVSLQ